MTSEVPGIIKIFYCYAREDEELRIELEKHLRPLKRSGLISEWHDRQIQAGTDWEREIETHLNTASIILLLVSPDFIFSDYCYGKEMKRALERHESGDASVIPIILRPVHWEETPIGSLQALPTDGEPITLWPNRDKAFLDVAKSIHGVVKRLQQAQFRQVHNIPPEDILIEAYKKIQNGSITSPSAIRTIASTFETIANDSFASKYFAYDATRAAKILFERAEALEKALLIAEEEQARHVRGLLRLDIAQLTDVGRKREHNEDNMAYVIPKDQQVMEKKGALFIVADGMGEHAAGEVASEIAVDTVSNMYYQDDSNDVAISLLRAIKHANASIGQRAAENRLPSGMGTTCVVAVLRGNITYIANVGNSRMYIVHSGQIKQVTQDHLWGTEQVRAGFLTEDQARAHIQRNKVTRYLGVQSDVEIDIFVERLEKGDSLVLCTDGLFRLVSDDEICRIVVQSSPQESVYHLVEKANENGGDDNITSIVVNVLDC